MKGRNYGSGISRLYIRWLIPPFTSQSRDVNLARMFPIRFCCELVHRIIFHSHLLKGKPSLLKLLLLTKMEAGHGGVSGRYKQYHETAFRFAFLLDLAGIHK